MTIQELPQSFIEDHGNDMNSTIALITFQDEDWKWWVDFEQVDNSDPGRCHSVSEGWMRFLVENAVAYGDFLP